MEEHPQLSKVGDHLQQHKVFIDNLPYNMNFRWLGNIFNKFGMVLDVYIPQKRRVVSGSKYGFVKYASSTEVERAIIMLNGTWLLHHQHRGEHVEVQGGDCYVKGSNCILGVTWGGVLLRPSNKLSIRHLFSSSSGHPAFMESMGEDTTPSRHNSTPRSPSPQPIEHEQRVKVCLFSIGVPKEELAEGFIVSVDPLLEVDGEPLGQNYSKVFVELAKKPTARLEVPRPGIKIIGESLGRCVVWRSCDVLPRQC